MVKNLFLFIFIYSILLTSCMKERKHTNPFDPLVNITTSPTGLTLEQTSVTSIKLSWNDTYDGETGYRIDRKVGNGKWQQEYAEVLHNTKIYNDTSTQPLQTYYYKVSAQYDANYSLPISGNLTTNFPAPSNIVSTQTGASMIKLTWMDNSVGEEGFVIDRKAGTGVWVMNYASVTADTTQYVDSSIAWGTPYYYRVKGKSGIAYSAEIETSLTPSFPAPNNLVLTQTGATSISLHWQDNTTWEDAYIIDRKVGTGNWILNYASASVNAIHLTDSAVFPDSMYTYRIKAKSGTVFSNSIESTLTPIFPAPSNLKITQNGATSLLLQWHDNNPWEDSFIIDRKVGNGAWFIDYYTANANVNKFTDTDLTLGTTYSYRIKARTGTTISNTIESSITTLFPAPSNLVLTQNEATSLLIQWQDNSQGEDGFIIDRKTGNGNWVTNFKTIKANATQFTDRGLTLWTAYTYRVKAYVGQITSNYSDESTLAILPVSTPTFNPIGGIYNTPQTVSISCTTPGATIRYTIDGNDPTYSSAVYDVPLNISTTTTIIKAKAFKNGWVDSQTASATYTLSVATPTFYPIEGTYYFTQTVSISSATPGATIRYTTDDSEPTSASAIYSSTLNISSTTKVKAKAFKTDWIDSQTVSATYRISPIPTNFVLVEGGTFNNGTSDVTVSNFYIDMYELTQSAYQAIMGNNPAHSYGVGSSHPVYFVSWFNAIKYCNKRSIAECLTPCYSYSSFGTNPADWPVGWDTSYGEHIYIACSWTADGYRLPTEAEWEFAARGGNQTHNYTYSGSNNVGEVAWYLDNSYSSTHPVGCLTANELGLFDMSGNVWEWNWDKYGTFPSGAQTNPHGAVNGSYRVLRGSSWNYNAPGIVLSYRSYGYANDPTTNYVGFRLCRIIP